MSDRSPSTGGRLAALGAWLGWQMLLPVILIAAMVGAVIGIAMLAIRRQSRATPIPFGPFLAAAGWPHAVGVERHAFYEGAETAYAIVQTGERRFYGNVLLTKGTIAVRADRIVVRQDADGFQTDVYNDDATAGGGDCISASPNAVPIAYTATTAATCRARTRDHRGT